jgi:hypothetical protein
MDGSHVNLEGSCPGGGNMFPDSHYHKWPASLTDRDLASGRYLRPLTRTEEFALFLETRGHCLADNGRFGEARDAYEAAFRFAPNWSQRDCHLHALALLEATHPSRRLSCANSSFHSTLLRSTHVIFTNPGSMA